MTVEDAGITVVASKVLQRFTSGIDDATYQLAASFAIERDHVSDGTPYIETDDVRDAGEIILDCVKKAVDRLGDAEARRIIAGTLACAEGKLRDGNCD